MKPIDESIKTFINEHHVMSLATCESETPYICSCFYILAPEESCLIFLSDETTRHGGELLKNPRAAAGVHFETREVSEIKGVQMTGLVETLAEGEAKLRELYLTAFPVARGRESRYWKFSPDYIKMTDNSIKFGHKQIWRKDS